MNRLLCLLTLLPIAAVAAADPLTPRVRVETTAGTFVIEVDAVRAPLTAENFLRYVRDGFYDGTVLHRVVAGFVVQGGGFDRAYAVKPTRAPIPNESGNGLSNRRGAVGLARGDSPHSGTSQFYVNLADNLGLNPLPTRWGYAVFGAVVEGMDVVDRIAHVATGTVGPFGEDAPLVPIAVVRAVIVGEEPAPPAAPSGAPSAVPAEAATGAGGAEPPGEPAEDPAGDESQAQAPGGAPPPGEPGAEPEPQP